MKICLTFTSVSALRLWLQNRCDDEGSEAFSEWLNNYFDEGNEIYVHDECYNYCDCLLLF